MADSIDSGTPDAIFVLTIETDAVNAIRPIRNPDKLAYIGR